MVARDLSIVAPLERRLTELASATLASTRPCGPRGEPLVLTNVRMLVSFHPTVTENKKPTDVGF